MSHNARLSRREFLRMSAFAAAGALLASCAPVAPRPAEEEAPAGEPAAEEAVEFEFWTQDWGPVITIFENAAQNLMEAMPNATVTVKRVPYADLEQKLIPAVAAGTEGDGVMSYDNFWQVVDFTKLLLPLTPGILSVQEAEELIYASALDVLKGSDGQVYAFPFCSGTDGSYVNAYVDHLGEGYDFDELADGTWQDLIAVAREQTQWNAEGQMTRAGLNVVPHYQFHLAANWILSLGATFYNAETQKWSFQTPEAEWAFEEIYKMYSEYKVSDVEFMAGAVDPFVIGLVAFWLCGAYMTSHWNQTNPEVNVTGFLLPRLEEVAEEDVRHWNGGIGIVSLSRKLKDDQAKRAVGAALIKQIFEPDNLLSLLDVYSGGIPSPGVYASPKLSQMKYGTLTNDFGDKYFARLVTTRNAASPFQADDFRAEIDKLVRGQLPVTEALSNMESQANQMESEAQARKSEG